MVCPKCGAEIQEGTLFCPDCGAAILPLEEDAVPHAPQISPEEPTGIPAEETMETPAEQNPFAEPFNFASPDFTEKKPKKKKSFLLLAAGVIALVVILAVALNFQAICGSVIRAFGSDVAYFEYVEAKALHGLSQNVADVYSAAVTESPVRNRTTQSTAKLFLSEQALNMIQSAGYTEDLSWLNEVELSALLQIDGTLESMTYGLSVSDQNILTVLMLVDMATQETYYSLPEITDQTIYVHNDYDDYVDMGAFYGQFAQISGQLQDALPSEAQVRKLLIKYTDIALKSIDTVTKSNQTLTLDGISQKCTVLRIDITQETLCDIAEAVLNAAKTDKELEKILTNLQARLTELEYDTGDQDLYTEFLSAIDEGLEAIAEERASITDNETLFTLRDYVDSHHQIIGRKITVSGDTIIYFAQVQDGNQFATQFELDSLALSGSGTVSGDKRSGNYSVALSGMELLKVSMEDVDLTRADKGVLDGTFQISPGKNLPDVLGLDMEASMLLSMLNPALELKIQSAKETATVELNLLSGGSRFAGITVDTALTDAQPISKPTGNLVDVNELEGMETLLRSLRFDQVLENLEKTGLPDSIMEVMEAYFEDLSETIQMTLEMYAYYR